MHFPTTQRRFSHRVAQSARRVIDTLEPRRLLSVDDWTAFTGPDGEEAIYGNDAGEFHCFAETHSDAEYNTVGKWNSSTITWGFSNLLDGSLPLAAGTTLTDIRNAVVEALGLWSAVTGIQFVYQADPGGAVNDVNYNGTGYPQIRIGHHFIDGATGLNVLAHCYFPDNNISGDGRAGDLHLDDSNTWGNGTGGGINTLETILHEIGHGLGLAHANGDVAGSCPAPKPAIMDACIQGRFGGLDTAYLFSDDIAGIQSLYGAGLGYVMDEFGVAHVYGTGTASNASGDNVMVVSTQTINILGSNFNYYSVSSTYGSTLIYTGGLNRLEIDAMGGNDIIRIDNDWAGIPISEQGGNGDDYFDFAFNTGVLGGMPQSVSVNDRAGTDRIWVYDDNTVAAQTYTITSARFDRTGWGGFSYDTGAEGIYMRTGQGADVVNVLSTFAGQPVTLDSKAGADVVNIGNGGSVQGIAAEVQINNTPSFTTLNINNGSDTGNRNWLINDVNTGYGAIVGLAPALIVWHNPDMDIINLTTGSGVDTGSIARLSETLNISNAASNPGGLYDQITFGNASAAGMQSITQGRSGGITVDNNPSYTRFIFDDTGDGTARTVNLDIVSSYNQLTGLAPATIRFDDTDTREVTLVSGSGADAVNVLSFGAVSTGLTLNSAFGNDTVTLGNSTNGLQSLGTPIIVRNSPAFTTLNINNSADTVARSATIDYSNVTDLETLSGLAGSTISWDPGDILSNTGVIVTTGSGRDSISVLANERMLSLTTSGAAGEELTIGPDLGRIHADLFMRDPPNFTVVTLNDTANTTGRGTDVSRAVIGTELFSTFTANTGGKIYLKAVDVSGTITLNCGPGDDTVAVAGIANSLAVNTNNGNDAVIMGGLIVGSHSILPIGGPVSVNGGAGSDTLAVNDQDYASAGGTITVNNGALTSNHSSPISSSNFDLWDVYLSNAGATFTAQAVSASQPVYVTGGTSHDAISVYANLSYAVVSSSVGLDDVAADPTNNGVDGGLVLLNGAAMDLGSLFMGAGATVRLTGGAEPSVRVQTPVFAGGKLDLTNGTFLLNYSGASPIATVRNALLSGRNGGAWNGPGLMSSTVGATPYAIGYSEITSIRSAFPAAFGGFSNVDNTTIVARYTLLGDANLDKTVNFDDLLTVAQKYNTGSGKIWVDGDFDYNGLVNFDDLLTLAQRYGNSFSVDWNTANATPTSSRVFSTRKSIAESVVA